MIDTKIGIKFFDCLYDSTTKDKIDWEFVESENGFVANVAGDTIEVFKASNKDCIASVNDTDLVEFTNSDSVKYLYNAISLYRIKKESILGSMQNIYKELTGKNLIEEDKDCNELKNKIENSYKEYKKNFGKEPTSCLVKVWFEDSSEPCEHLQTIVIDGESDDSDSEDALYCISTYDKLFNLINPFNKGYYGFVVIDFYSFN
jgi:hypothetical protein